MLTKRHNLLETIHGGHPDRFVNQFEAFAFLKGNPFFASNPSTSVVRKISQMRGA